MDYIKAALRTEIEDYDIVDGRINTDTLRLLHASLGVAGEAGELVDAVKRHVFYGAPLDVTRVKEELGDTFWFLAIFCDVLEVSFEELQAANVAKLRARYPQKYTDADAINRDLDAERRALEGQG